MRRHEFPDTVQEYPDVTRITVVLPDGIGFERYNAYPNGVELHLQDDGRTLKIFPIINEPTY
jgi:hypothetical protein